MWTGENDSNTLRVDAYFSENGGKKSPFSKISRYLWTGPEYNMTQRKSCVTCQREPFAMLISGLGAVFQENYHVNFAESIIFCFPYDIVTRRW